jgi:hypothetical protein
MPCACPAEGCKMRARFQRLQCIINKSDKEVNI